MEIECNFMLNGKAGFAAAVAAIFLFAGGCGRGSTKVRVESQPSVEEYATLESVTNGVPVWSFSNLTYIYGVSPDYMPGLVVQEGNTHPVVKIKPKKSWEIKHNLAGTESEMTVRSAINDSQPMLPIHLIDGDPETLLSKTGLTSV